MSEVADRGVDAEVDESAENSSPSADVVLRLLASRRVERRTFLVPVPDEPDVDTSDVEECEASTSEAVVPATFNLQAILAGRGLDDPAMRLHELTEIERMRDLEIARLEQELAEKSATIFDLETALFHAERRGDDLDRRWNELAGVYEETASALVETGARLDAVHRQTSYRLVLSLGRAIHQRPSLYRQLQRLSDLIVGNGHR